MKRRRPPVQTSPEWRSPTIDCRKLAHAMRRRELELARPWWAALLELWRHLWRID